MSRFSHSQAAPTTLRSEVIAWLSQDFVAKSALRGLQVVDANPNEDYVFGITASKGVEFHLQAKGVEVAIDRRTKDLKTKGGTPLLEYSEMVRIAQAAYPQKEGVAEPQLV